MVSRHPYFAPVPTSSPPTLSVIVASDGAGDGQLQERFSALARACKGLVVELILVVPSGEPTPPREVFPGLRIVRSGSELVPAQWGSGIRAATGSVVALTTTQFRVTEGWAYALLHGLKPNGTVGVGGRIRLAPGTGYLGRAAYFVRYSEHMGDTVGASPRDPAGENAAYHRAEVLRSCRDLDRGFWEVDAHRTMRSQGGAVTYAPDMVIDFAPLVTLGGLLRNRFVHGGHFGAYRVAVLGWSRLKAFLVTPLVPMVLFSRILGRVVRSGTGVARFLGVSPGVMLLLCAWAVGEARGALLSRGAGAGGD